MIKAKDLFIRHVTSLFEGDGLAAQSLLLNLTSSLTHRHPIPLGSIPMNIYSTPPEIITNLTAFLRSVVPALAVEPLSVDALNRSRLYPKSDGDKLCAGSSQLISGTTLLINDTMQEGKLLDTGILAIGKCTNTRCSKLEVSKSYCSRAEIVLRIPISRI